MGNCQSASSRHARLSHTCMGRFSKGKEQLYLHDGEDVENDLTLPLSPDATTLVTVSSFRSPHDPFESPATPAAHEDIEVSVVTEQTPSPSNAGGSTSSTFFPESNAKRKKKKNKRWHEDATTPRQQTSAFKSRLERSSFLQMSLSSPDGTASVERSRSPITPTVSLTSWDDNDSGASQHQQGVEHFDSAEANLWMELEAQSAVSAIAFSKPQSTLDQTQSKLYVAVGTDAGKVTIKELREDATTNEEDPNMIQIELESGSRIRSLNFSSDGKFLAFGGDDCLCQVYSLVYSGESLTGVSPCVELERVDRVYAVQFSPDGRFLAIGGYDGTVAILATEDIKPSTTPELITEIASSGLIFSLDWSPDSKYLAFGGSDKICSIVDVSTSWDVAHRIRRPATIQTIEWSPTGNRYLAIGSSDLAIVEFASLVVRWNVEMENHGNFNRSSSRVNGVCWSPNGSYLVVSDSTDRCTLYETKSFVKVQVVLRPGIVSCLCWGQQTYLSGVSRGFLAIGDEANQVAIIKAGLETAAASVGDDLSSAANTVFQFSTEGDWVLKENGFKDVDEPASKTVVRKTVEQIVGCSIVTVAFSRGSKSRASAYLAYSTADCMVTVLSVGDWQPLAELKFPQMVTTMAFTNGSKYLAYGCGDSRVYVSDTSPAWQLVAHTCLSAPVEHVNFSKNNALLGAATSDGKYYFLDANKNYTEESSINSRTSMITAVDWSTKYVSIGREDGIVEVFNIQQTAQLPDILNPVSIISKRCAIRSLSFGLSGRFLAIGMFDGGVGIYSEKGGWVLCHQLKAASGQVTSLLWSPTSRFLAVADSAGSVRVMDTVFWADVEQAAFPDDDAGDSASQCALSFSQDGNMLALARRGREVQIADCRNWQPCFKLRYDDEDVPSLVSEPRSTTPPHAEQDSQLHDFMEHQETRSDLDALLEDDERTEQLSEVNVLSELESFRDISARNQMESFQNTSRLYDPSPNSTRLHQADSFQSSSGRLPMGSPHDSTRPQQIDSFQNLSKLDQLYSSQNASRVHQMDSFQNSHGLHYMDSFQNVSVQSEFDIVRELDSSYNASDLDAAHDVESVNTDNRSTVSDLKSVRELDAISAGAEAVLYNEELHELDVLVESVSY